VTGRMVTVPGQYAVMRMPGRQAIARAGRYGYARPRRMAIMGPWLEGPLDALEEYVARAYPVGHRQYAGHHAEWRNSRSATSQWRRWDGSDVPERGRDWRVVVKLRNGRVEHEVKLEAWRVP
jgi:hypothetical protein